MVRDEDLRVAGERRWLCCAACRTDYCGDAHFELVRTASGGAGLRFAGSVQRLCADHGQDL